ncbi:MAG: GNAT family N-acetyltransferase [Verrucomicrobiales bacterium]|nr:GNAT family N-acetyltransferase [Verrucomicrobiales bacterium]
MSFSIGFLNVEDLDDLDELARPHRKTLGFLTLETFKEYIVSNRVLGAKTNSGKLVGYLLFADYPDRIRLSQLCVSPDYRGRQVARMLVERLKELATTQFVIKLRCRRDFPAYSMWPRLGFVPIDEKVGRSADGHLLTLWSLTLRSDDHLGLWRAQTTEEEVDVAIDAQIFFDFEEPDSPKAIASKALQADFLAASLNLWITDELFSEIDRNGDPEIRTKARTRAHGMRRVFHDSTLFDKIVLRLREFLPYDRESSRSDIHHLAMTAASDIQIFATRDQRLLDSRLKIHEATNVEVIHPVELISKFHEVAEKGNYSPERVAGMHLRWQRIRPEDLSHVSYRDFQLANESKAKLKEKLIGWIAEPTKYQVQILWESTSTVSAVRVIATSDEQSEDVVLVRVSKKADLELVGRYIIADSLCRAVKSQKTSVKFRKKGVGDFFQTLLQKMGFLEGERAFTRFVFSGRFSRDEVFERIGRSDPKLLKHFESVSPVDLERNCSPLILDDGVPCFTVPIIPTFARGLIDQELSADDLFGGDPTVLLRWENVYYRKPSHHKMLQSPARILWYVSREVKEFVAVSHLDEVVIGKPKELFKRFRKFGILEWADVFSISEEEIENDIMALKFSHTFPLQRRISLEEYRKILEKNDVPVVLQSPFRVPNATWQELADFAFPNSNDQRS